MLNDLEIKNMPLEEIIFKWKSVFTQSYSFAIKLSKQMFSEYKYPAI